MAVPAGYTELGRLGFVDRANYVASATYRIGDVVSYSGSTWTPLKDNLKGVVPVEGANWKYMAKGYPGTAVGVSTKDTSGLLGAVGANSNTQALIDAIADKVITKLLLKTDVISQILDDPTKAASMAALFGVNQAVTSLNGEMTTAKLAITEFGKWKLLSRYVEIEPGINYWFSSEALVPAGETAKYRPVIVSVMESSPEYYITSAVFSEYGTLGIKLNKANANASKLSMTVSILYLTS